MMNSNKNPKNGDLKDTTPLPPREGQGRGSNAFVRQVAEQKYEFGFTTDVHTEIIEKGLNEVHPTAHVRSCEGGA